MLRARLYGRRDARCSALGSLRAASRGIRELGRDVGSLVTVLRAAFGREHLLRGGETRSAAPGWRGQTPDSALSRRSRPHAAEPRSRGRPRTADAPADAPAESSAPEGRSGSTLEDRRKGGRPHPWGARSSSVDRSRLSTDARARDCVGVVRCVGKAAAEASVPGGGGPEFGWPTGRPNESPPPEGMLADARPRCHTHAAPKAAAPGRASDQCGVIVPGSRRGTDGMRAAASG